MSRIFELPFMSKEFSFRTISTFSLISFSEILLKQEIAFTTLSTEAPVMLYFSKRFRISFSISSERDKGFNFDVIMFSKIVFGIESNLQDIVKRRFVDSSNWFVWFTIQITWFFESSSILFITPFFLLVIGPNKDISLVFSTDSASSTIKIVSFFSRERKRLSLQVVNFSSLISDSFLKRIVFLPVAFAKAFAYSVFPLPGFP